MSANDSVWRLQNAVRKLAGWLGTDISELVEDGLIKNSDLETADQTEPHTISTPGEADALPIGTLIREYDGFLRLKEGEWSWLLCVQSGNLGASDELEFPAVVLFAPGNKVTA